MSSPPSSREDAEERDGEELESIDAPASESVEAEHAEGASATEQPADGTVKITRTMSSLVSSIASDSEYGPVPSEPSEPSKPWEPLEPEDSGHQLVDRVTYYNDVSLPDDVSRPWHGQGRGERRPGCDFRQRVHLGPRRLFSTFLFHRVDQPLPRRFRSGCQPRG